MKNILILFYVFSTSVQVYGQSPEFNAENAFRYLEKQCEFGPRNPGSAGHKRCLEYLTSELRTYADDVQQQSFQAIIRPGRTPVKMTNIIAKFQSTNRNRILLCAHWDTRPWADQDQNPVNRDMPVLGANDGASGVAVLLEIARIIHNNTPLYGIDIVFFDGEDYGLYGQNESWAIGSKEFASRKDPAYNPHYGILVDLIGDQDQQIFMEHNSLTYAPEIVHKVWKKAEALGITEFIPESQWEVMDDHIRLLEVGIRCINIIDFDYKYWHTTEDTPDKCSPKSLSNVGRVITAVIYE